MIYILGLILVATLIGLLFNMFVERGRSPSMILLIALGLVSFICGLSLLFCRGGTLVLAIIMMAFSFVGMLYCARKQRSHANAQTIAIALLFVVLVCMITILTLTLGSGETKWLIENELKFAQSAAIVMGQRMAEKYPKAKALVLVYESYNNKPSRRQTTLVDGLKEGFDGKIEIVAVDCPVMKKPENLEQEEQFMMMEEMLDAEAFNKVIAKYPQCNLIISLIGLPYDVQDMNLWTMEDELRPKLALMFGEVYSLKNAIAADLIDALTYKPDIKFTDDPAPSDPKEAFEKRYIIVDSSNIGDLAGQYKHMFQ